MPYRLAIDIGGTFTDLVLWDEASGALRGHKILTTPRAPEGAALRGLRELCDRTGITPSQITTLIHATTLVTNAIIERKGAPTALLTTAGFRDTLEMGKEQRYDIYDLFLQFPEPLVPRRWRIGIRERVTRDGAVRIPLNLPQVRRTIRALVHQGVESVAVSFLHAYRNPAHEQLVKNLLQREFPQLSVSIGSEVSPEIREYERTSTTVCNAYVQPLVDHYLRRMETALAEDGFRGRFLLMLSSGTLAAPDVARRFPVRLLESGPAAGALLSGHIGSLIGQSDLVGFDMGGTTAKICLVQGGRPKVTPTIEVARVHRFKPGSGMAVKTPVVDMIEIGAGGGSVAGVDSMGLLHVGPHSAGAEPGPACYGKGGTQPTVTDAKLVAGVLNEEYFLGGKLRVHPELARRALAELGRAVGASPEQAANGVIRLVNANMINALKLVSVRRGHDPRDFVLVAAGGGGPMHAAALGAELQVKRIVVPPYPGVFSAWGMLVTEPRLDLVRTRVLASGEGAAAQIEGLYAELEAEALARFAAEGAAPGELRYAHALEMRYAGQEHTVRVPVERAALEAGTLEAEFHRQHRRRYTFDLAGTPVEVVTFHLTAFRAVEKPPAPRLARDGRSAASALKGRRAVDFDADGVHECPVYERDLLPPGFRAPGPLLIEEAASTTLVHPAQALEVHETGCLLLEPR